VTARERNPLAAELANHWEIAGALEKAFEYYELAGQQALRIGAGREASDYLLHLLALDDASGTSTGALSPFDRRVRRARWHRLLCLARWALADLEGALEHGKKVLEIAGAPLPRAGFALKRTMLTQIAEQTLHLLLPRAFYRARRNRWPLLTEAANAAAIVSECGYWREDVAVMVVAGLRAVNLAERMGGAQKVGRAYSFLAIIANMSLLKRLARRYFDVGRRVALEADDIDGLMHLAYSSSRRPRLARTRRSR
jgi:hypothetical protein